MDLKSKKFPTVVSALFSKIEQQNEKTVLEVSAKLAECIMNGGLLFVFGSGHSGILSEEAFHRAGGLVPVYPILHSFLSPHITPKISGKLERLSGVAEIIFRDALTRSKAHSAETLGQPEAKVKNMIFIASNSGINAAAIEMAQCAQKEGFTVVGFTNLAHSKSVTSRHSSGKKLYEFCDYVLDNSCPKGDALIEFDDQNKNEILAVAAGSTLAHVFIYNWILTETVRVLKAQSGKNLPVYRSANLPGSDQYNEQIELIYKPRITLL